MNPPPASSRSERMRSTTQRRWRLIPAFTNFGEGISSCPRWTAWVPAAETRASSAATNAAMSPPSWAWTGGMSVIPWASASSIARPAANSIFTPNRIRVWWFARICAPDSENWALIRRGLRWTKHVLPRDEHVAQDDEAVRFVEARRERAVEPCRPLRGVRLAGVQPETGRGDRDDDRDRVVLVARLQRERAEEDPVGDRGRRPDHLGAPDDDPVVALLYDARVEEGFGLIVGRLGAIDLGRGEGRGEVPVVGASAAVERAHPLAEADPAAVEDVGPGGEGRDQRRDMVRRPAHEPERAFRPVAVRAIAAQQVARRQRRQPDGAVGRLLLVDDEVRPVRHAVVQRGDRPDRGREPGMRRDVLHGLPVQEHDPAIAKARYVLGATTHAVGSPGGGWGHVATSRMVPSLHKGQQDRGK